MSAVRYCPPPDYTFPRGSREWALLRACEKAGLFTGTIGYRDNVLGDAQELFKTEFRKMHPKDPLEIPTIETFGAYLRSGHGAFKATLAGLNWIVEPPGQDKMNRPTENGKEWDGRLWAKRLRRHDG
jgi:hypothetical protein